jgi:hypothetical protein
MQKKEEGIASEFMAADASVREKIIAKLLDRAKSDRPEEKQRARADALVLAEGLARAVYSAKKGTSADPELLAFLSDLDRFIPILHERSAPLKLIFEHLLLVLPKMLTNRA